MDRDQVREQFLNWLKRWLEKTSRPAGLAGSPQMHYDRTDLFDAFQAGYIQATSDATMKLIDARPQAVTP